MAMIVDRRADKHASAFCKRSLSQSLWPSLSLSPVAGCRAVGKGSMEETGGITGMILGIVENGRPPAQK